MIQILRPAAITPVFAAGEPLRWRRNQHGDLLTNVARVAIYHSPTGFEIGYPGSGPADLALNACAALFPGSEYNCRDGSVSRRAFLLHQAFKLQFLVRADQSGGEINWEQIAHWLKKQGMPTNDLGLAQLHHTPLERRPKL